MWQGERAVNEDLKVLSDAHRLGQISTAEYRSRRRHLLIALHASDGSTARNPISPKAMAGAKASLRPSARAPRTQTQPRFQANPVVQPYRSSSVNAGPASKPVSALPKVIAALVVGVVIAGAAFWFLKMDAGHSRGAAITGGTGTDNPVASLEAQASRFVEDNRWEAADVNAFLQNWRSVDAETRAKALQTPSLARLREQIAYNLRVTRLLQDDAAPGNGKAAQARMLSDFDRELGASAS